MEGKESDEFNPYGMSVGSSGVALLRLRDGSKESKACRADRTLVNWPDRLRCSGVQRMQRNTPYRSNSRASHSAPASLRP